MIDEQRPLLRVVTIAPTAEHRTSEHLRLAALGARADIALTVLAPTRACATPIDAGGELVPVQARRWLPGVVSGRLDTVRDLATALGRLRPDVLHVHQEPGSLIALQALRVRDRILRGTAVLVESEQADMNLTTGLSTHVERHVLRRAEVLAVRHKVRLELARNQGFAGHGVVVGYGIDRDRYRPGLRQVAREAIGITGFTIGYLGQLEPESGLADVLEAIAAAKVHVNLLIKEHAHPSASLRGSMRDEIVDRATSLDIADRVRFVDATDAVEDVMFLSALDALVLMRRSVRRWRPPYEHIIPEAQACGVPVIAAGLSGIPTLVGPGGWIVGERDAGLLARLLQRLATQPDVTEAVSAAALAHIGQHGTLDGVSRELRRAFDTAYQARQLRCAGSHRDFPDVAPVPQSYRR